MNTRQLTSETQEYVGNVMSKSSFVKMKNFDLKQQKKSLKKLVILKNLLILIENHSLKFNL